MTIDHDLETGASSFPGTAATLRKRLGGELNRVVEAWLLWVTVGALTGVLILSPSLQSPTELVTRPAPSASDIEQAVAQAEAEGIAAGAAIKPRAQ
ncbi:hypothetical protein E2493_14185 [Sphingomonas parva]|uniref:Uncharacterized protein n=1 Tax=Sphingomonas parva TaxID=2555898 RepID=A0A4Y8ZQB7_9SPHN|nr:hypothetical protein [Sphingomonas parva]TFI57667.1 hypothetical protein E2493_14185 [Sphingomonas parva]